MGSLFSKKETHGVRIVHINETIANKRFPTNRISNTKYNVITFFPKNLLEQFGRFMNLYFLMIACLQLWSVITPVDPASTWVPLALIFAISAIKEGVDDFKRYLSDKKANERVYYIIRDGEKKRVTAQEIRVGEIIYLEIDSEVPCDMVLLCTSDKDGACYIQTANLDGETDYKSRQAPQETLKMNFDELVHLRGIIECATPNPEIYRFDSRMKLSSFEDDWFSLSEKQLLLQATHIKNTDWLYGVAVYTGNETKLGQNKTKPPVKWTKQDRLINRTTIFIFIFQLSLVLLFGAIGNTWMQEFGRKAWYLAYPDPLPWYNWLIIPLRFLLLNSMMIPISLKVSLDVIKYCYAKFIDWDTKMIDTEEDIYPVATSTAISEDLGQVEYIFSDKTGTLTENRMVFSKCSIGGVTYGRNKHNRVGTALEDPALHQQLKDNNEQVVGFFTALAVCHSVVPTKIHGELIYKASSPDEEALVKAAAKMSIVFKAMDNTSLEVDVLGSPLKLDRLEMLNFSSDRRRMSVIVCDQKTGTITLYCKGSDDVIFPRLKEHPEEVLQGCGDALEQFAQQGLRTLCIAYRTLDPSEYQAFHDNFQSANMQLDRREEQLAEVYEQVERELTLLGASAIEDKLQEGVPQTISILRQANIKIWMLTGDKYSTAVQIAKACNLVDRTANLEEQLLAIRGSDSQEIAAVIQNHLHTAKQLRRSNREFYVIIEGKDLSKALPPNQDPIQNKKSMKKKNKKNAVELEDSTSAQFLELTLQAHSVICCRVTPKQKAQIVALVKNSGNAVTLAIGDGGNDVSMIQEAHVGVGIAGREGLQAARAADYSFGKFRFLQRLILIHGRYSYIRTSFVAQYCFYKSLFICFIQILYCFFTGFSGTSFFNTFSLTTYNVVFTGLPPLFYVLDQDLPERAIMDHPEVYVDSQSGKHLNRWTLIGWGMRALLQSIFTFAVTMGTFAHSDPTNDTNISYDSLPLVAYTVVVVINAFTVLSESHHLTLLNHVVLWGTLVSYFVVMLVVSLIPSTTMYGTMTLLYSDPQFWLVVVLTAIAATLPLYGWKYYRSQYRASFVQYLRYQHRRAAARKRRRTAHQDQEKGEKDKEPRGKRATLNIVDSMETHKRRHQSHLTDPGLYESSGSLSLTYESSSSGSSDEDAANGVLTFSDTTPLLVGGSPNNRKNKMSKRESRD